MRIAFSENVLDKKKRATVADFMRKFARWRKRFSIVG
jgi:hypothetical protein